MSNLTTKANNGDYGNKAQNLKSDLIFPWRHGTGILRAEMHCKL